MSTLIEAKHLSSSSTDTNRLAKQIVRSSIAIVIGITTTMLLSLGGSPCMAQETETEQESATERLKVDPPPVLGGSKIEFEGLVTGLKKYSLEVTGPDQSWQVRIGKDTALALKCSSPRIDFEKSEAWVGIEGADNKFKAYKFKTPLYVQAQFSHQHQLKRIMSEAVKRFPTYALSNEPFAPATNRRQIFLAGKLEPGETGRQLKMTTDAGDTHQVLLSKHGEWLGFTLSDLRKNQTVVRISGKVNAKQQIIARKILFWPVKKPK